MRMASPLGLLPNQVPGAFRYSKSLLVQEWGNVLHWSSIPENEVRENPVIDESTPCLYTYTLAN